MRFYNCGDDERGGGLSYTSDCNKKIKDINTSYSSINTAVQAESASGGTPIASALNEAKLYLDVHKAADNAKDCRQKFVILITDGSDTYACNADGSECDNDRYKNRRAVVAKAQEEYDASLRARPDDPLSHFNMANRYQDAGDLPAAVAEYRIALRLEGVSTND